MLRAFRYDFSHYSPVPELVARQRMNAREHAYDDDDFRRRF